MMSVQFNTWVSLGSWREKYGLPIEQGSYFLPQQSRNELLLVLLLSLTTSAMERQTLQDR